MTRNKEGSIAEGEAKFFSTSEILRPQNDGEFCSQHEIRQLLGCSESIEQLNKSLPPAEHITLNITSDIALSNLEKNQK